MRLSLADLLEAHPDDVKRLASYAGVRLPAKQAGQRSDVYRYMCASKVCLAIAGLELVEEAQG